MGRGRGAFVGSGVGAGEGAFVGLAVGGCTGGCVGAGVDCNLDTQEADSVKKLNIVEDELEAKLSLPKLTIGSIMYSNEPAESLRWSAPQLCPSS